MFPSFSQSGFSQDIEICCICNKKPKFVHDPIHGNIELTSIVKEFVDKPEFQRLRSIQQLGAASYVYPGATHNRFTHCLGVGHLAREFIDRISSRQPELDISDSQKTCIQLAGLLHDIGHGPFSHLFYSHVVSQSYPDLHIEHEEMSCKIIQHMVDKYSIEISKEEIKFIQELISPPTAEELKNKKYHFLYQIVSNPFNSIDVDKFDYMMRDTYYCGIPTPVDYRRLIDLSYVIKDELCFHSKEVLSVCEFFQARYNLFQTIYVHRVVRAIELMISDILIEADRVLNHKYTKCLMNMDIEEYCTLTDDILKEIELDKDPSLYKAQEIIKKMRNRDLYKFVDEIVLSTEQKGKYPMIKIQDIISLSGSDVKITEDDVILDTINLSHCNKEDDPLLHTHFYRSWDDKSHITIKREQVTNLTLQHFNESVIRVYSKNPDNDVKKAILNGFRAYWKNNGLHCEPSPFSKADTTDISKDMLKCKSLFDKIDQEAKKRKIY